MNLPLATLLVVNLAWATTGVKPEPSQVAKYAETHNGSAPPRSWYLRGDPWRNFTAEEANEMLEPFEVKP